MASKARKSQDIASDHGIELLLIAIDDIDTSDRLRPIDPDKASAIGASMLKDGQLQPVDVCRLLNQKSGKPYRLVFGGHRVGGAKLVGMTHILAIVRSADALERKAREVAENFFRADASPIDQAVFVAELIAVEKARLGIAAAKDGNALNGDKRSAKKQLKDDLCNVHKSLGLQESVAAKLGLNQSAVSRHLALNAIDESLLDRVRALPIGENAAALRQLAKLDPADQAKAVAKLEAGAKTLSQAMGKTTTLTPEAKRQGAFLGAWGRMSTAERKSALRLLSQQPMPKGFGVDVPGVAIVAEAAE